MSTELVFVPPENRLSALWAWKAICAIRTLGAAITEIAIAVKDFGQVTQSEFALAYFDPNREQRRSDIWRLYRTRTRRRNRRR